MRNESVKVTLNIRAGFVLKLLHLELTGSTVWTKTVVIWTWQLKIQQNVLKSLLLKYNYGLCWKTSCFLFYSLSGELQDALGVTSKSLPPFIYRMRQLGYPPGWLKEAEMEHSGLALYDGKGKECAAGMQLSACRMSAGCTLVRRQSIWFVNLHLPHGRVRK